VISDFHILVGERREEPDHTRGDRVAANFFRSSEPQDFGLIDAQDTSRRALAQISVSRMIADNSAKQFGLDHKFVGGSRSPESAKGHFRCPFTPLFFFFA